MIRQSSPDWDPSSVLWVGPNREIVGSGADVSNETLAQVDDLCLAARDEKGPLEGLE